MSQKISCIIMDWAGTALDFGCFAPLQAFMQVFSTEKGLEITVAQAREPMGMLKIDHIKAILSMPSVNEQFIAKYGRPWNDEDVKEMNESFEKHLFASLPDYTTPIEGVIETLDILRAQGLKIGSTTGYTAPMMEIVRRGAAEKGYLVDALVSPTGMPAGRPAPFMIYENMKQLNVQSVDQVVKVGDTLTDIREGTQAKCWSVGVIIGSSELGLSQTEVAALAAGELAGRMEAVRQRMFEAGADFVLDTIRELPGCIEKINQRLD